MSQPQKKSLQVNPLICIPSPRNIGVVKEAFDEIKGYDKLWFKENYNELQVYEVMRNYFLEHKEYTHFVIMPDDLLVDVETIDRLISDLKKRDYPVLSGVCNFNCDKFETYDIDVIIDWNHQSGREYLMMNEIPNREYYGKSGQHKGIKRVAFSGFPLTFIRRDVLEKVPFASVGKGIDSEFSVALLRAKIEQYVDFDARNLHLKGIENCEDIGSLMKYGFDNNISTIVNFRKKVTPRLYLERSDGTIEDLDYTNWVKT